MSIIHQHPTLVCVIVYDRLENVRRWLHAWRSMLKPECKIAIVHNKDRHDQSTEFEQVSFAMGADYYLPRRNRGFDCGAMRDVIDGVLTTPLFEPEVLHWCVDDSLPMRKDSVVKFRDFLFQDSGIGKKTGLVGCQLSSECGLHLRTNSFCLRMETAKQLRFGVTANTMSKDDCYFFEHGGLNFKNQIESLNGGMQVIQAQRDVNYYFWDTGHLSHYNLWEHYYREFGEPTWKQ